MTRGDDGSSLKSLSPFLLSRVSASLLLKPSTDHSMYHLRSLLLTSHRITPLQVLGKVARTTRIHERYATWLCHYLTLAHAQETPLKRPFSSPPHQAATLPLPKVDTSCTALSLMPTVNGNTVRSFSTHGHQSAAKGSSTTVSRSGILYLSLPFLFGSVVRRWRLIGYFPILYNPPSGGGCGGG
jgi:hypothetical protein